MDAISGPGNMPHKKTIFEHISYVKVKYVCIDKTHTLSN